MQFQQGGAGACDVGRRRHTTIVVVSTTSRRTSGACGARAAGRSARRRGGLARTRREQLLQAAAADVDRGRRGAVRAHRHRGEVDELGGEVQPREQLVVAALGALRARGGRGSPLRRGRARRSGRARGRRSRAAGARRRAGRPARGPGCRRRARAAGRTSGGSGTRAGCCGGWCPAISWRMPGSISLARSSTMPRPTSRSRRGWPRWTCSALKFRTTTACASTPTSCTTPSRIGPLTVFQSAISRHASGAELDVGAQHPLAQHRPRARGAREPHRAEPERAVGGRQAGVRRVDEQHEVVGHEHLADLGPGARLAELLHDAQPQLARRLVGQLHAAPGAADAAGEVVRGRPRLGQQRLDHGGVERVLVDDGRDAGVDVPAVEGDPAHRRLAAGACGGLGHARVRRRRRSRAAGSR